MARRFRFLTADEIECRVAQCSDKGVQLLLYKTARTDAALLDEVYPDAWQNDFKVIDGKMYGGIGIKVNSEWLWRWDCGTESNMEAEKGEASDAFKRAGFKWGIGAELYSSPFVWVKPENCKIENRKCYDRFKVSGIDYDENGKINFLAIDNVSQHKAAFHMGAVKDKKDEFAANSLLRTQILKLADGDMDRINSFVEKLTNGQYHSLDGMNSEQLTLVKLKIVEAKKNASK